MRRQYFIFKTEQKLIGKNSSEKSKLKLIFTLFFLTCLLIYAYSVLSISALVYGNVASIVQVFFEKQLLTPLAIVTALFALKNKSDEVSAFIGFIFLLLFSAYFVYIYSSFFESTDFVGGWQKDAAKIGYFLNQILFGLNFLCMLAVLSYIGFRELKG